MATEKNKPTKETGKKKISNEEANSSESKIIPSKKSRSKKDIITDAEPSINDVPAAQTGDTEKAKKVRTSSKKKEETIRSSETKAAAKKKTATKKTIEKSIEEPVTSIKKASTKRRLKKTVSEEASNKATENTYIKNQPSSAVQKITFQLRFHTKFGQQLFITGNHEWFGNNDLDKALPMQYLNAETWMAELPIKPNQLPSEDIVYNYVLISDDGSVNYDWGNDKALRFRNYNKPEILIIDSWNHAGFFENAFYTEPFQNVLLRNNYTSVAQAQPESFTHIFKVKAPLLTKGQAICLLGNADALKNWNVDEPVLLNRKEDEDFWSVKLDLSQASSHVAYKYGVYDVNEKKFVGYEGGNNRLLKIEADENLETIVNDGFAILPDNTWKGAGVAIPVFSLRSEKSFGVGEFTDIKLLVDWAKKAGLKLVQLLPVNDTSATNTWTDSYPYAAISAFALHPMYLNLHSLANDVNKQIVELMKMNACV